MEVPQLQADDRSHCFPAQHAGTWWGWRELLAL